jgi:tRNA dimethylallyltransferase
VTAGTGEGERYRALAIVGPTASGKTALAVEVARRLGGEVISMDSRQVYREMEIGTAKPSPGERGGVPHHGFDLTSPAERFSAGRFARFARPVIEEIRGRGGVPVLTGGTGFFLRALTHPIFRQPEMDTGRRAALARYLERLPDAALHRWLRRLDPPLGDRYADWGGRQRLLRALEMPLLTGRPLSWWQTEAPTEAPPVGVLPFVLDVPRDLLNERIEARARAMIDAGLLDEVARLIERYGAEAPGLKAHGYMELVPYLRGETGLDEAVAEMVLDTRRYARRQRTWFRNQLGEEAVWLDATRPREELAESVQSTWDRVQAT